MHDLDLASYDWILVESSAGKDSQAMLDEICRRAAEAGLLDRVVVLHCDLGHVEWPGTARLARRQAQYYGVRYEERHRQQGLLLDQIRYRRMWPDINTRYCTSDQKRGPSRKLITALVGELGELGRPARVLNCLGLRGEESKDRRNRPSLARDKGATSGVRTVDTWLPIQDWTEKQVWARIHESGAPYHPAYDAGMRRLSCSLCVLASKEDLMCAAQLRPALAAEYAALETEIGHRFKKNVSIAEIVSEAGAVPMLGAGLEGDAEPPPGVEASVLGEGMLTRSRVERPPGGSETVMLYARHDDDEFVPLRPVPAGFHGALVAVGVGELTGSVVLGRGAISGRGAKRSPAEIALAPDGSARSGVFDEPALYACMDRAVRLELWRERTVA